MNQRGTITLSILIFAVAVASSVAVNIFAVDNSECTSCNLCIETCPVEAISMVEIEGNTGAVIDPALCTGCGLCEESCPIEAIMEVPSNLQPEVVQ